MVIVEKRPIVKENNTETFMVTVAKILQYIDLYWLKFCNWLYYVGQTLTPLLKVNITYIHIRIIINLH